MPKVNFAAVFIADKWLYGRRCCRFQRCDAGRRAIPREGASGAFSPRRKHCSANWNSVRPSLIYVWNRSLTYTIFGYPFRCIWLLRFVLLRVHERTCALFIRRGWTMSDIHPSAPPTPSSAVETPPASRKVTDAPSIITGLTLKNIGRISQTRKADKLRQFWNFDKLV
jgi:hypothetical protein